MTRLFSFAGIVLTAALTFGAMASGEEPNPRPVMNGQPQPKDTEKKEDAACKQVTKATVAKISILVMRRYDSYLTRRVPLDFSLMTPQQAAEIRLFAIRDLMRMEMPERWTDVSNGPMTLKSSDGRVSRSIPQPSLARFYMEKYSNPGKYRMKPPGPDHASAKCLYLWVMLAIPEAKTMFTGSEIANVDGDGWSCFVDGWRRPIGYLRWAPGFSPSSDIQIADPVAHHDPFDSRNVDPASYRLFPLIYAGVIRKDSNGCDDYGINSGQKIQPTVSPCSTNKSVGIVTNGGPPLITSHQLQKPNSPPPSPQAFKP